MRTISFQTLLTDFAGNVDAELSDPSGYEARRLCARLNAAALWLWEVATHSFALPDILEGKTVTLGAGGIIAAADIEHAAFWSVWQSDPRELVQGGGRSCLQIRATGLGNGDVKVSSAPGAEVFVIYKRPPPQWTVNLIAVGLYAKDTLLWNAVPAELGDLLVDGHVYRAQQANADAADIEGPDPLWWQQVTLPQSLQMIVVLKATEIWLRRGAAVSEAADRERGEMLEALDAAVLAAQKELGSKPWLYNHNE